MATPSLSSACVPGNFADLTLAGADILGVSAQVLTNVTELSVGAFHPTAPTIELKNASFCNVTVTYTHAGQGDRINVEAWLPLSNWNHRFQAAGGGGWVAGRFLVTYSNMYGALANGFATSSTDAGLTLGSHFAEPWATLSPGNPNLYNLNNLASVSLNDQAVLSKAVIKQFYGSGPEFSYWSGCSQGGRQGMMLAQRYPDAYDGIDAGAPAINWGEIFPSMQWPQQIMSELGYVPFPCELDALTAAAVAACDGLDGVEDGIIGEPVACLKKFDPFTKVGTTIQCAQTNSTKAITEAAATVANATWNGMRTAAGKQTWFGLLPGTDITGTSPLTPAGFPVAASTCNATACAAIPVGLPVEWIKFFVARNAELDLQNLTRKEFDRISHLSVSMYDSIIGTSDADLSVFRERGGKIISFHGLADTIIPPQGSEHYYKAVEAEVGNMDDFYRYYEIPGLGHCSGGPSGLPSRLFGQLQSWVENGTAPDTTLSSITTKEGTTQDRIICPYPQKAVFDPSCGKVENTECFSCVRGS
ncbi:Tannase/feruloyl esterase [Microdochium bolleyi]|uniref:Carboxylic ester hydrolase n=1 Tax=Microdochium bolleyi TaxID=196109 RepID=A0A136IM96_9PEZI|nr:Tannase/feruloyl esterase [Microdochium bolleyi]